jgi:hypothetical protein
MAQPLPIYRPLPMEHLSPIYQPGTVYHPTPVNHAASISNPAPILRPLIIGELVLTVTAKEHINTDLDFAITTPQFVQAQYNRL